MGTYSEGTNVGDDWKRRVWTLIGFVAVMGLLIVIRIVQPIASAWLLWAAVGMVVLYLVLVVAMALLLAAFTKPPQPLAEISILGRYGIGMLKVGLAPFAFFAKTAVSWTLSVSLLEPVSPRWQGSPPNQIWGVLLQLFLAVAFFSGMAIAVDLLRSGKEAREALALGLFSEWGLFPETGGGFYERAKRWAVLKVAGTHGGIVLLGFMFTPYAVVLAVELVKMLSR